MKRKTFIPFIAAAALIGASFVGAASAQLPIRIPRPRIPVNAGNPQATAPTTQTNDGQPANQPSIAGAQSNKSAIDYDSLMNLRFYEANGGFLVEGLEVVFPSAGGQSATFLITRPGGEVVSSVPLRYEPLEKFPAFGVYRPASGNPGSVRVSQSGDFLMAVKIGGETVTTLPFTLKEQVNADPFNPGKVFVREGPWKDLAFFSQVTDDPTAMLHFNFWMSTRELPAGMLRPKVTLHLLANGKEVAASRGPVVPDTLDWYFYERKELIMETQPKQKWLNLADLTRADGEIVMVVKADGKPIKSYKTQVTGGKLLTLDRNRLETQPRTDFISPRYVDLTDRSRSDFTMRDMFWVKKGQ